MTVLKLRTNDRFGNWGLEVRRRVPTTDGFRTPDTLLNNATDAELAAYMASRAKMNPGKIWDGYFKPMLEAMDKATRDEVLSSMAEYQPSSESGEMERGPSGSLASIGDDEEKNPDGTVGKGKPNSSSPQTKDNIGCNSRGGIQMRDWRNQSSSAIDAMNKANEKFWKK